MITHEEARQVAHLYAEHIGRDKQITNTANKLLGDYIRALPDKARGAMVDDLLNVVWSVYTITNDKTG